MNKEEFSSFLNSEIESLRSEIQRPGWTTWALAGALAALIWVLLSLIEQGGYSLRAAASLLLAIWFLMYSYPAIRLLISPSLSLQQPRGRLVPTNLMTVNMPVIILIVGQLVFITVVILRLSTELGGLATGISLAAVSYLLFSALACVVMVIVKLPLAVNPRHRVSAAVMVISSVILLLAAWYILRFVLITPGGATVDDVRLALVVAAVFELSCRLVSVPRGTVTLDLLTRIRRELLLGRTELETAIQQVDIALTGMRASDLLESYVANLLSLYRDAGAELSESVSLLEQLEKLQPVTEEKLSPEQRTSMHDHVIALKSSVHRAHDMVAVDIPRAYRPIAQRIAILEYVGFKKDSDDLRDLDRKLNAAKAKLTDEVERLTKKLDEVSKTRQLDEPQTA